MVKNERNLRILFHGGIAKMKRLWAKQPYLSVGLFCLWDDGQLSIEITYKNGKLDRLSTDWHENERIDKEVTCKDGKIISSNHKKDQNKLL